ncbi:MAG: ATP-binding protein [Chloroflexi bacterium]|nr:ATP-binding protein [Chloroflexota bacterium]
MPVDLAGPIFALYEKALARAKAQQQKGNMFEAAAAYRQCADHLTQYAGYTTDPRARAQWLEKAKGFRELAEHITTKGPPIKAAENGGDANQYDDEVAALIFKSPVSWIDIGGLAETKNEIKTAYGLSMVHPPKGIKLRGWRNLLFYGPPGTGKTLLAAATSNGLEATFFNVKVSNLLSKYFGESTKLVSALYAAARRMAPSVVFLDEIESLVGQRGGTESGAELRVVSTFLAELDGLTGKADENYIMTIGATNIPWMIDKAILSRFEKKIYVPLPDIRARESIFKIHLASKGYKVEIAFPELAKRSEGYSGREIEHLATEAVKHMVEEVNPQLVNLVDQGRAALEKYELRIRPLNQNDFDKAFARIKPQATQSDLARYQEWRDATE